MDSLTFTLAPLQQVLVLLAIVLATTLFILVFFSRRKYLKESDSLKLTLAKERAKGARTLEELGLFEAGFKDVSAKLRDYHSENNLLRAELSHQRQLELEKTENDRKINSLIVAKEKEKNKEIEDLRQTLEETKKKAEKLKLQVAASTALKPMVANMNKAALVANGYPTYGLGGYPHVGYPTYGLGGNWMGQGIFPTLKPRYYIAIKTPLGESWLNIQGKTPFFTSREQNRTTFFNEALAKNALQSLGDTKKKGFLAQVVAESAVS